MASNIFNLFLDFVGDFSHSIFQTNTYDVHPVEPPIDPAKVSSYRNSAMEENKESAASFLPLIEEALKK